MTSNTSPRTTEPDYPIYTVRWLAIHLLGVPTVWFLGAIASMQFIHRQETSPTNAEFLGIDFRLFLVLVPLVGSILWTVINFGGPTVREIQKTLAR